LGSLQKIVGFPASGFSLICTTPQSVRPNNFGLKNAARADLSEHDLPSTLLREADPSRLFLDKSLRTRTTLERRKKSACWRGVRDAFFSQ
jgi:hypothetical protein